jgi:catechol 2,3-dioxygenase-like lactoylglutathione lyase family enzyme
MQVEQVDFVSVPTRNPARAIAFYRDVLGLSESEYAEGEIEAPNVTFGFWNPEAEGEDFMPNTAGVALRVADVAAAVEELRAAGAEVVGIEDTGVCHMGFVKDPDGNVLILHRRYAPRTRRGQG